MKTRTVRLGDVADFLTGFPFKSRDYSKDGSGIRLLRGDNIGQGFLRWDGAKLWPHHSAGDYDKFELKGGDVVLAMDRPWVEAGLKYSVVNNADLPALLVQRVTRLRGTESLDIGYLRYLIGSQEFTEHVHTVSTGTAVPHISGRDILAFEFELPEIEVQKEIARTLGALDDKIELNRRMSATLEEMARALYRSWFVDFDPVHARALGLSPAHMDATTAALFPDSFGPDGLPKGWKAGTLADLIEFNPKERLPKGTAAPYLEMKALPTSGMSADAPYFREFTSGTKFRERDTLLARITPCLENGKTAVVDDLLGSEIGWGSTEFIVMRAKPGVSAALPYCIARDPDFRAEAIQTMTGSSGRQRADAKRISELDMAIAPARVHAAFSDLVSPMLDRVIAAGQEARSLAALRDTLLPRLMSGELRIREAEKQVEEFA